MSGIQQTPDLFVVLGLWAENGVDLIEQDGGPTSLTSLICYLSEEVGRSDVHRFDRPRHKKLGDFQAPAFAAARLRRKKRDAGC